MISMLLYSHNKRELSAVTKLGRETVCRLSDDDWDFLSYSDKKAVTEFLGKNPLIDISCIDVACEGGISLAEGLRSRNGNMYIILLTDASVSPVLYIRPTIMAGSLLMRPLSAESVKRVFTEAVSEYVKGLSTHSDELFMIENRDGRQFIPYEKIEYFESRDKKLYVRAGANEYSFYGTLDNLEQNLPDGFLRCHRSFIAARGCIKQILLSQGLIILDSGCCLPLSRSYKSVFKEFK